MSLKQSPKQYLNQAKNLDERIRTKADQIRSLHELAERATVTLSDMPRGPGNINGLDNIITKIVTLEESIQADMDQLVDIRGDINAAIGSVDNDDYRLILEKRYILRESWDEIADELHMSRRSVLRAHGNALSKISETDVYALFIKNSQNN